MNGVGIGANDNLRPWMQGFTDDCRQAWCESTANRPGAIGTGYLSGWIDGSESSSPTPERLSGVYKARRDQ
jgi:hypothetical protein